MKTTKILYRVSTILLALFILPGIFFFNTPMAIEWVQHLWLPEWFRREVSIGTFIGGLILILPVRPRLKERAYVALGILYVSALIAHLAVDGVVLMSFTPVVTFAILLVSYITYHKLQSKK
jgi:hypothetical protein